MRRQRGRNRIGSFPAALSLDFLNAPDSAASVLTFTRASTGTYFDRNGVMQTAAAGVPRFDYDPATGAARGLLIEEQRTNLLKSSGALAGPDYGAGPSITVLSTAALAPDGTNTAVRLQSTQAASCYITGAATNLLSVTAGKTYTVSMWVRCVSGPVVGNVFNMPKSDFSTRTVIRSFSSFGVTAGGSWARVSIQWLADTTAANYAFYIAEAIPAGTVYELWGLQFEEGAFPTSYIPTTTASATRSADVASMALSSVPGWNASEGTVVAEADAQATGSVAWLGDGTYNNRFHFGPGAGGYTGFSVVGGSVTVSIGGGSWPMGTPRTTAFAFKLDDWSLAGGGSIIGTDTTSAVPPVTTLHLMSDFVGAGRPNGHLRRLRLFGRRLPDVQLQGLTA